jgi:hypothetical protein
MGIMSEGDLPTRPILSAPVHFSKLFNASTAVFKTFVSLDNAEDCISTTAKPSSAHFTEGAGTPFLMLTMSSAAESAVRRITAGPWPRRESGARRDTPGWMWVNWTSGRFAGGSELGAYMVMVVRMSLVRLSWGWGWTKGFN